MICCYKEITNIDSSDSTVLHTGTDIHNSVIVIHMYRNRKIIIAAGQQFDHSKTRNDCIENKISKWLYNGQPWTPANDFEKFIKTGWPKRWPGHWSGSAWITLIIGLRKFTAVMAAFCWIFLFLICFGCCNLQLATARTVQLLTTLDFVLCGPNFRWINMQRLTSNEI